MMANGALVRVLIHTGVTKYMSFKAVDGSYVFNKGKVQSPSSSISTPFLSTFLPFWARVYLCSWAPDPQGSFY